MQQKEQEQQQQQQQEQQQLQEQQEMLQEAGPAAAGLPAAAGEMAEKPGKAAKKAKKEEKKAQKKMEKEERKAEKKSRKNKAKKERKEAKLAMAGTPVMQEAEVTTGHPAEPATADKAVEPATAGKPPPAKAGDKGPAMSAEADFDEEFVGEEQDLEQHVEEDEKDDVEEDQVPAKKCMRRPAKAGGKEAPAAAGKPSKPGAQAKQRGLPAEAGEEPPERATAGKPSSDKRRAPAKASPKGQRALHFKAGRKEQSELPATAGKPSSSKPCVPAKAGDGPATAGKPSSPKPCVPATAGDGAPHLGDLPAPAGVDDVASAQGYTPAAAGVFDGPSVPTTPFFHIPEHEAQLVLTAATAADVPVDVRNKLQLTMGRDMRKQGVPGHVLARWADAKRDRTGKASLLFLQEWVSDKSFGTLLAREKSERVASTFLQAPCSFTVSWVYLACSACACMCLSCIHLFCTRMYMSAGQEEYIWATREDLMRDYSGYGRPEGKEYVDRLLAHSKQSRPHPLFPKDREMRLHKVLGRVSEGRSASSTSTRGYELVAEVAPDAAHAEFVGEAVRGLPALAGMPGLSGLGDELAPATAGADPPTPKRQRKAAPATAGAASAVDRPRPVHQVLEKLRERLQARALSLRKLAAGLEAAGGGTAHDHSIRTVLESHAAGLAGPIERVEHAIVHGSPAEALAPREQEALPLLAAAEVEAKYATNRLRALQKKSA